MNVLVEHCPEVSENINFSVGHRAGHSVWHQIQWLSCTFATISTRRRVPWLLNNFSKVRTFGRMSQVLLEILRLDKIIHMLNLRNGVRN